VVGEKTVFEELMATIAFSLSMVLQTTLVSYAEICPCQSFTLIDCHKNIYLFSLERFVFQFVI